MDFQKLLKIIAAVIGVISIIFLVTIISTGDDAIKAGESSKSVGSYMYVAYFILGVAIVSVVYFTVSNLISNASGLKKYSSIYWRIYIIISCLLFYFRIRE